MRKKFFKDLLLHNLSRMRERFVPRLDEVN